jgi:hypothetical protein
MASQAGSTAPPTRVSARAGTARSSAASAGLAKQHAEHKPDAKGRGKPPGAKDLQSRKARNGAGNYRNSQNPKHRQLGAVNEVSGALHEVSKYIKACPKEVQNTIAQHKHLLRWRNPSGDLDLSKPGDKRTFQRRNTEIAAVTGNDTAAHFAKLLEGTHLEARQLKIIIDGLNERLGKMPRSSVRELGVAFAHALDGPEALEINENVAMVLACQPEHVLPPRLKHYWSNVFLRAFARSYGLKVVSRVHIGYLHARYARH